MTPDQAVRVLAVFEQADDFESLMWRVMDGEVRLYALCNDVFFWATADFEEITADDVPLLEAALADLVKCQKPWSSCYLPELFAARKRRLRPQKPFYKSMPVDVAILFDACCTAEERAEAEKGDAAWWLSAAREINAGKAG